MKKIFAAGAALAVLFLSACNAPSPQPEQPSSKTKATESDTQTTTKKKNRASSEVNVKTETIKKTKAVKKKSHKPKATEATETTVPTTMPPTQGATKAGRNIVVTTVKGSFSSSDLDFIYGSETIRLNEKVEDVFTKLGDDSYEEPDKKRNIYDFDDFELCSYVEDGVERVDKITVIDENYSTAKGAKIGMYASRLRRIYGDADKFTKTEYVFGGGTKTLTFTYENNIVTGIAYSLDH